MGTQGEEAVSRFRSVPSYGQHIRRLGNDLYEISWVHDRYYGGSRLRYPRTTRRQTDLGGARRFARKWKIAEPVQ